MKWLENLTTNLPTLASGSHNIGDNQACLMELISIMEGEEFTDSPKCVSRVLQEFGMVLNDVFHEALRNDLLRLAPMLVGTKVRDHLLASVMVTDEDYTIERYYDPFYDRHAFVDSERLRKEIIVDLATAWTDRYRRPLFQGKQTPRGSDLRKLATVQYNFDERRKKRDDLERTQHSAMQVIAVTLTISKVDATIHQRLACEALGALEAAIKVGPHTPEMTGWLDVDHQLKAVQWVAEYA